MRIDGRSLHRGSASAEVAKLSDTISFWGGIDMSGTIIDQAHPQTGTSIAGKIVALPGSRGSSGTPAALCEMLRRSTGPAAILVTEPDINIVVGAMVAAELYEVDCPVVLIGPAQFDDLVAGETVTVNEQHRFEQHRFEQHRFEQHRFEQHRFEQHRFGRH